ncbi:MARVEL domain-containing protein 3 isoform X1 [Haliaeetus albicilla]|uniref:MARVEL domain-containing protein 3 isoform X1 n=1 Tax=Haliaeetus albicilla TaxID=8969 RepID=UPI0037E8D8C4
MAAGELPHPVATRRRGPKGAARHLPSEHLPRAGQGPATAGAVHRPWEEPARAEASPGRRGRRSHQPAVRPHAAPALAPRRTPRGPARPGLPPPPPAERGHAGPWRSGAAPAPRGRDAPGRSGAPCPERGRRGRREAAPPRRGCWSAVAAACCQMVGALLAALILVCSSVSYGSSGGYTGLPSLGGIYYYQYGGAYSGFSGADGEKAQQLDQRFYLLKLPIARAAMAVGGCLLVLSCVLIVVGVLRLPWHFPAWLLLECVLDTVIAIGMVPALYYFFHFLLEAYNSSVCKEREQLYQSKGYQGFSCSLHGAEIAAGLSGCAAVMAYLLSAGLAARGYRTVHRLKQKPVQLHAH